MSAELSRWKQSDCTSGPLYIKGIIAPVPGSQPAEDRQASRCNPAVAGHTEAVPHWLRSNQLQRNLAAAPAVPAAVAAVVDLGTTDLGCNLGLTEDDLRKNKITQ